MSGSYDGQRIQQVRVGRGAKGEPASGLTKRGLTLSGRHSNRSQKRHFETGKGLRNDRIVHWQLPTDYAAHHCAQESGTGQISAVAESAAEAIPVPSVRLIAPHLAAHRAVNLCVRNDPVSLKSRPVQASRIRATCRVGFGAQTAFLRWNSSRDADFKQQESSRPAADRSLSDGQQVKTVSLSRACWAKRARATSRLCHHRRSMTMPGSRNRLSSSCAMSCGQAFRPRGAASGRAL
jgi:hypothetical protein